jgi:hypothetical protein
VLNRPALEILKAHRRIGPFVIVGDKLDQPGRSEEALVGCM